MEFNIVVGNPPYNGEDGNPIYNKFIEIGIRMSVDYISMVIPSRWINGGRSVLDGFREYMVRTTKLSEVHHYFKDTDVFKNVMIAGGVMYFLWDNKKEDKKVDIYNYRGRDVDKVSREIINGDGIVVLNNKAVGVIEKVSSRSKERNIGDGVSKVDPFGIGMGVIGGKYGEDEVKVVGSYGKEWEMYVGGIGSGLEMLGKWKVICNRMACGGGLVGNSGDRVIISKPMLIDKESICTQTYLVISIHDSKQEGENMIKYMNTKFVRYIIAQTLSSSCMTNKNYKLVPYEDLSGGDIDWGKGLEELDKELYRRYGLSEEEVEDIERSIRYYKE